MRSRPHSDGTQAKARYPVSPAPYRRRRTRLHLRHPPSTDGLSRVQVRPGPSRACLSPCQLGRAVRAVAEFRHPCRWQGTLADGDGNGRSMQDGTPRCPLGEAATHGRALSARTRQVIFRRRSKDWRSTMSTTLPGFALPRRLVSVLMVALFGLTLSLNPVSTPNAHAAVSAIVGSRVLHVAAAQVGVPYKYGGTSPRTGFSDKVRPNKAAISIETRRRGSAK